MATTVQRYRCDLCGKVWLMLMQAEACEQMCEQEELDRLSALPTPPSQGTPE